MKEGKYWEKFTCMEDCATTLMIMTFGVEVKLIIAFIKANYK